MAQLQMGKSHAAAVTAHSIKRANKSGTWECTDPPHTCDTGFCFQKDKDWAECLSDCTPGMHDNDPPQYKTPWSCKILSAAKCSTDPEDCGATRCCVDKTHTCFEKDPQYYRGCAASCTPGKPMPWEPQDGPGWTCNKIECTDDESDCSKTKCCLSAGRQCYTKDANWAGCLESCEPGKPAPWDQSGSPWECKVIGGSVA